MHELLRSIAAASDLQSLRDLATDTMLRGAGLTIARQGEPSLDAFACVTARQRALMLKVGEFGYRVKFSEAS